jgi:magnesium transporter
MSIAVRSYNEGEVREVNDPNDISELVGRDGRLIWVDLLDPTDDDFACVQREFDLHPLAMEDARKHGQRPKLEQYPTHAFIVAYSREQAEVDLFFGVDWLVSVRGRDPEGGVWDVSGARSRFERTKPEHASVGFLLYTILDELVDGYFNATDDVEERLETLEDSIFSEQLAGEKDLQQRLFDVRRRLVLFRRRVVPLREVIGALLRRQVAWIDQETLVHLQDVYDHVLRVIDLIDAHRELMGNAVDAHRGYPFALGLMAAITVLGYRYFRRKDWL